MGESQPDERTTLARPTPASDPVPAPSSANPDVSDSALATRPTKSKASAYEFARTIRRGRKEFCGLEFHVDRRVLTPIARTERLVEMCLEFARGKGPGPLSIADVGTGSGAIAVALAVNLPHAHVFALEYFADALAVAHRNARAHGVDDRITLLQGDLLAPLPAPVDLIAANLPYIRTGILPTLTRGIRDFEPPGSLDGGPDGLRHIRRLIAAAPRCLNPHGGLFLEMADDQGEAVRELCRAAFPTAQMEIRPDAAGRDRFAAVWT